MNMQQFMKQAQVMQKKMAQLQDQLSKEEFIGIAGSGEDIIKVKVNAKSILLNVEIANGVFAQNDSELLEDMIMAAFNDASKKANQFSESKIAEAGIPSSMLSSL